MSGLLWKYFLEDDVDSFRQVLEEAAVASRPHAQKGIVGGSNIGSVFAAGSLGALATSPSASFDSRKAFGARASVESHKTFFHDVTLGRADVNRRDGKGLTLLHYAATSTQENAVGYAMALIAHPLIDLYVQDWENGWTALHRAFYFGNITIARAILEREAQDAIGQGSGGTVAHGSLSLVKIKDRDGNGPYDLLTWTIKDRTLQHQDPSARHAYATEPDEEDAEDSNLMAGDSEDSVKRKTLVTPCVDVEADELFTFGSNKNITLGLGNEDDRQHPERVALRKPDHLYRRFYREHVEERATELGSINTQYADKIRSQLRSSKDVSELPAIVRFRHGSIQDVEMSKFHTAVLTNDPVSNLYMCGHGVGGRLGTGNQKTQFSFVCIEDFSGKKKIVTVALGQDHSLAVTDQGEVFSWGSNIHGQLGLGLSKATVNPDDALQLVPKQIFGPLKREVVVGAAASRMHSVVHTSTALYSFGKNEGQLGIVDAHAGSLEIQAIPRRVAASRFSSAIQSVCAIDRATICLLENHEVHVFANYGITKLLFPLDGFTNYFLKNSFLTTKYDDSVNRIVKITGGGDTICALSSAGEIFAVTVGQCLDPGSSSTTSTTNPNKIKAALSTPARIWSLRKGHMTARDVGVDQDGSIILSTEAGSVWKRSRRPYISTARGSYIADKKSKEFKFSRIPGLTRVMAVRASGSGAYCAMRRDCDVTRSQIIPFARTLWQDIGGLLPFKNFSVEEDSDAEDPTPRFWSRKPQVVEGLIQALAKSKDPEKELGQTLKDSPNEACENYDVYVCTTVSEVRIPVHQFILAGRSRVLRQAFAEVDHNGSWTSDLCTINSDEQGVVLLTIPGVDFLTLVEFVLYLYTDRFAGFWLRSMHAPHLAYRYRQVRAELMKIALRLELKNLESAARRMSPTAELSLHKDIEYATTHASFFQSGDALVELADGEALVHIDLMSRRCPFFEGLFQGRAAGRWLADRREMLADSDEAVAIDMKHIESHIFQLVLRHIYADTGEELFDDIVTKDLDEFLDVVLDVLSVANELMLDRLSQICQMVLGRYVNVRNACQLLNAVAPSAITDFKDAGLEYLCLNLEAMLSNHHLDELDEDLLHQLDIIVRDNQLASMPYARSGRAVAVLHEKHPELAEILDRNRRAKIDSINLHAKFADHGGFVGTSFDPLTGDEFSSTPARSKGRARGSVPTTPTMNPQSPAAEVSTSIGDSSFRINQHSSTLGALRSTPLQVPLTPDRSPRPAMEREPSIKPFAMLPPAAEDGAGDGSSAIPAHPEQSFAKVPLTPSATTRPWGATPLPSAKLGIQEIMQQTFSRPSNISLGLASASQTTSEERVSGSFTTRISQKERRKQQQQQQNELLSSSSPASAASPWQSAGSRSKSISKDATALQRPSPVPTPPPGERSGTTTPQLTMRQTVANTAAIGKQKEPILASPQVPTTPVPQRSVSTPQASRPSLTQTTPGSSASKPIQIQSVRHTPRSHNETSPTFFMHQSMADILSQQQAEKYAVKEAVAKRSLMEIQQEQEFLSWWDQESKRAMEEEERAAKGGGGGGGGGGDERGRGRGGRSRGGPGRGRGRGGRGRGREKEKEKANTSASASASTLGV